MISSRFVSDLALQRQNAPIKHIIHAIGSSSLLKATTFIEKNCPLSSPIARDNYHDVYNDPNVDIVYIGTPHTCHFDNALDAINAGKNVLCEKPMTINAEQTRVLMRAAREKGVLLVEGMQSLPLYPNSLNQAKANVI